MIYLVSNNQRLFNSDKYEIISFKEALDLLSSLKEIQLDTETSGLDCHVKVILTLQLGCTENQVVFDYQSLNSSDKIQLKEFLESDILLIGYNIMFDLTFLYKEGIYPKNIYDAMIAEQLLYLGYPRVLTYELVSELNLSVPQYEYVEKIVKKEGRDEVSKYYELSYSLKATAHRRLGIDIDKTVRGKIITVGITEETILYAANDVAWLQLIKDKQLEELAKEDLCNAIRFESEFVKSLAYVKYCGIHLDSIKWRNKMNDDERRLKDAVNTLDNFVIDLDKVGYIYRYATSKKELERILELNFERCPDKDSEFECYRYNIKGKFVKENLQLSLFEEYDDTGIKCTINWSSSQQVIKLFELLGIQVKTFDKKTKKEKKSIEEKQISPQADKFPIIKEFLKYQAASKVVSTYGQNWLNAINPVSGRIHVELHSIGTDTSRISSGGGIYKLNQQNLPNDKVTRGCFTPEKGNKFISCDFKSQESRLIASISDDAAMIDLFEHGCSDLHSLVAYMAYPNIIPRDTRIEDIQEKYHDARQDAKGIEFSINYGGDFNTIASNKGIPLEEAKEIYDNFMSGFPGVAKYQDYRRKEVMNKGYIRMNNILGHVAHIYDYEWMSKMLKKFEEPDFWNYYREMKKTNPHCDTVESVKRFFSRKSDSEKQSINYPIQNAGACCFKLAMIKFFNWIVRNNYTDKVKLCAFVHDEVDLECPEDIVDEVSKVLLQCMESGAKPFCTKVWLGADLSIGDYWIH